MRKNHNPTFLLLAFLSGLVTATLSPASGYEETLDPVQTSPRMYQVLLDNEVVRVVSYRIDPGQKDEWHTHPAKVTYVVQGGRLKITRTDGSSVISDPSSGSAKWMGAVGRHFTENIGETPVHLILVEVKSAHDSRRP